MADLSQLSDDELLAAIQHLGEKQQALTNAVAAIRSEQADRQRVATAKDEPVIPPQVVADMEQHLEDAIHAAPGLVQAQEAARVADAEAAAAPDEPQ